MRGVLAILLLETLILSSNPEVSVEADNPGARSNLTKEKPQALVRIPSPPDSRRRKLERNADLRRPGLKVGPGDGFANVIDHDGC